MNRYSTCLKQIFCDGSVVNYCEDAPSSPGARVKLQRWTDGDEQSSETIVKTGYLNAKVAFLKVVGQGHKILAYH